MKNATTNSRFNFGAYLDASLDITKDFLINGNGTCRKNTAISEMHLCGKVSSRYKIAGDKFCHQGFSLYGLQSTNLAPDFIPSLHNHLLLAEPLHFQDYSNNRSKQAFRIGDTPVKGRKIEQLHGWYWRKSYKENQLHTWIITASQLKDRIVYSSSIFFQ